MEEEGDHPELEDGEAGDDWSSDAESLAKLVFGRATFSFEPGKKIKTTNKHISAKYPVDLNSLDTPLKMSLK